MHYAGFKSRFYANLTDYFVICPALIASYYFCFAYNKFTFYILIVPTSLIYFAYTVYLHGKTGKTIGKKMQGIQVLQVDGKKIGWKHAFLRSSVDLVFAIISVYFSIITVNLLSDQDFVTLSNLELKQKYNDSYPSSYDYFNTAGLIWVMSEVFVLLFNDKRRAIHDFLGGTVVVFESRKVKL